MLIIQCWLLVSQRTWTLAHLLYTRTDALYTASPDFLEVVNVGGDKLMAQPVRTSWMCTWLKSLSLMEGSKNTVDSGQLWMQLQKNPTRWFRVSVSRPVSRLTLHLTAVWRQNQTITIFYSPTDRWAAADSIHLRTLTLLTKSNKTELPFPVLFVTSTDNWTESSLLSEAVVQKLCLHSGSVHTDGSQRGRWNNRSSCENTRSRDENWLLAALEEQITGTW